jgi:hypothetical protein
MSPLAPEMQNADPSTRVTVPPGLRTDGCGPVLAHGATIAGGA